MRATEFLNKLQQEAIVDAIRKAEEKTSGEIRVFITRKEVQEPLTAAQEHFVEMGMAKTRERNGVLLFVAPRTRTFAIVGDSGIHARCGQDFWDGIAQELTAHFAQEDFSGGLLAAVDRTGTLLAQHFPPAKENPNELSDELGQD